MVDTCMLCAVCATPCIIQHTMVAPCHGPTLHNWTSFHHNTTHADDAGGGEVMCDKQLYLVSSYRCCYHISPSTLDIPQYWTRLVRGCTLDN